MSKSVGNVINPVQLIDHYGKDYLRYYLVAEVPFGYDGNFTLESFVLKLNSDLANDVGNLVQRVLSMVCNYCDGIVPEPGTVLTAEDRVVLYRSVAALLHCRMHVDKLNLKGLCEEIVNVAKACNKYMDNEAPWKLRKDNIPRFHTVIFVLVNNIRRIAILLNSVVPTSSETILNQMSTPNELRTFSSIGARSVAGLVVSELSPVFPKLYYKPGDNKDNINDLEQHLNPDAKMPSPSVPNSISKGLKNGNQQDLRVGLGSIDDIDDNTRQRIHELLLQIENTGQKIRELKKAKTEKLIVKPFIDELLQLKEQLKVLKGATATATATATVSSSSSATTSSPSSSLSSLSSP